MRSPSEMSIIQIDITNACHSRCSNCTRLIGHQGKDDIFFMSLDCFKKAVDSLVGFPEIVGIIGGDPVLHPQFEEILLYLEAKVSNPGKRGLWSSMPPKFFTHFALIQRVFPKWQFLNDRGPESGRPEIKSTPSLHQPMMVAIRDVIKDEAEMWRLIDECWVQNLWSATITPKGAFVCEVMGAWDNLYHGPGGMPVEPGWWNIKPTDEVFKDQVKRWCPGCGGCLPSNRRKSSDIVDDISRTHLDALKDTSPKLKQGKYVEFEGQNYDKGAYNWHPNAEWYLQGGPKDRLTQANQIKYVEASKQCGGVSQTLRETAGLSEAVKHG